MTDSKDNIVQLPPTESVRWSDGFVNLMAGLGVPGRDKFASQQYTSVQMSLADLETAYRSDWIARKVVTIPAWDMTRQWRDWQADPDQIELLEAVEKKLMIQQKVQQALIKARLYGGAAIIIGVDVGAPEEELNLDLVTIDTLKFLHVVSRHNINAGPIIYDISSKYFGQPEYYEARNQPASKSFQQAQDPSATFAGQMDVRLHPSRVVKLVGMETADQMLSDIWGDSVLQPVNDAIKMCGLVTGSLATLMSEMKLDIIKIPELKSILSTADGERKMIARFSAANAAKSVVNTLMIDGNEEWQRIQASFAGMPEVIQTYMQMAAGAADIPATRFLGMSPRGLNATGESDIRNYYDRLAAEQTTILTPTMTVLDEVIIRSALGERPPEVWYQWATLWQMTASEKAEVAVRKANAYQIDVSAAQIPTVALANARVNQLIEDGTYPGLEKALEDAALEGDTIEEHNAPAPPPMMGGMMDPTDPNSPAHPMNPMNPMNGGGGNNVSPFPPKKKNPFQMGGGNPFGRDSDSFDDYNENHDPENGRFASGIAGVKNAAGKIGRALKRAADPAASKAAVKAAVNHVAQQIRNENYMLRAKKAMAESFAKKTVGVATKIGKGVAAQVLPKHHVETAAFALGLALALAANRTAPGVLKAVKEEGETVGFKINKPRLAVWASLRAGAQALMQELDPDDEVGPDELEDLPIEGEYEVIADPENRKRRRRARDGFMDAKPTGDDLIVVVAAKRLDKILGELIAGEKTDDGFDDFNKCHNESGEEGGEFCAEGASSGESGAGTVGGKGGGGSKPDKKGTHPEAKQNLKRAKKNAEEDDEDDDDEEEDKPAPKTEEKKPDEARTAEERMAAKKKADEDDDDDDEPIYSGGESVGKSGSEKGKREAKKKDDEAESKNREEKQAKQKQREKPQERGGSGKDIEKSESKYRKPKEGKQGKNKKYTSKGPNVKGSGGGSSGGGAAGGAGGGGGSSSGGQHTSSSGNGKLGNQNAAKGGSNAGPSPEVRASLLAQLNALEKKQPASMTREEWESAKAALRKRLGVADATPFVVRRQRDHNPNHGPDGRFSSGPGGGATRAPETGGGSGGSSRIRNVRPALDQTIEHLAQNVRPSRWSAHSAADTVRMLSKHLVDRAVTAQKYLGGLLGPYKTEEKPTIRATDDRALNRPSKFMLSATLLHPDWPTLKKPMALMDRTIDFRDDKARHDLLEFRDEYTGKGLAKPLLKAQIDLYKKLGLDHVDANANINRGGYAWGKFGFLPSRADWVNLADELDNDLVNRQNAFKHMSEEDRGAIAQILESSDPKAVWALADSKHGKQIFQWTDWNGRLYLSDRTQMKRFNAYVKPKAK